MNPETPGSRRHRKPKSNLNRRGRQPRTTTTEAEFRFCGYFVLTGNVKQASVQAGHNPWWGYDLLKLPRIQAVLHEFEERKKEEGWATATSQVRVTREFLDEQFILRLVNMKTHPKLGDMPIVKMLETGYKRTGDISPTKIGNQIATGPVVIPGATMAEVYKAKWLRDKEAQLARQLEAEHGDNSVTSTDQSES